MGRINYIWNPRNWKKILEGKSKVLAKDVIYKMVIGVGEDTEPYEIIEFISKENYDNIINGVYSMQTFPYAEMPILLFDENNLLIPLVRGIKYPYDKLNREQKLEIENGHSKVYSYK